MTSGTTWLVSDLHLDTGPADARNGGAAFVEFLRAVIEPDRSPGRRLILLGDTFELAGDGAGPGRREDRALLDLALLAARHQNVLGALRRCVEAGTALDIVAGNHDVDLLRPRVRLRLTEMLTAGAGQVRVHSWAVHLPGVLHASHGHQHHDLNRSPTLLAGALPGTAGELPMAPLAVLGHTRGRGRRLIPLLRAFRLSRRCEAVAAGPGHTRLLDLEAAAMAIPPSTAAALHAVSRFSIARTVARLAYTIPGRRLGLIGPDRYMVRAAARTHATLAAGEAGVPVLVYGHTHRARQERLPGNGWYLNCGTWSSEVRGDGPDSTDPTIFPYVVVRDADGTPTAALEFWHWDGAPVPVSSVDGRFAAPAGDQMQGQRPYGRTSRSADQPRSADIQTGGSRGP